MERLEGQRRARGFVHDFRHVLMSVVANAEVALSRLPAADPARGPLEQIRRTALGAGGMLEAFLEWSAGAHGRAEEDLDTVVGDVEPTLRKVLGSVRLRLDFDAPGRRVALASGEIQRLLWDLASNALDAMPHGGELSIQTRVLPYGPLEEPSTSGSLRSECVALRVVDTGTGMGPELEARAFDPFVTTKPGTGSGLGPSSVRDIVEEAGGGHRLAERAGPWHVGGGPFALSQPA